LGRNPIQECTHDQALDTLALVVLSEVGLGVEHSRAEAKKHIREQKRIGMAEDALGDALLKDLSQNPTSRLARAALRRLQKPLHRVILEKQLKNA
jgi:hypothetical protein